jgi:excisionase family DNA binding protein
MSSGIEQDPLLTPAEVAAFFRVDSKTVTRWAKAGKLTSIRTLGGHRRYREAQVLALLAGTPEQPPDPLKAPLHSLWPRAVTGAAATVLTRLQSVGSINTVGDLTTLTAADLQDVARLRSGQVDEVRLVLHRKGLALYGEVADRKVA